MTQRHILDTSMDDLAVFLKENEMNIAYDISYNLGGLKDVFYDVFGRYPAKTEVSKIIEPEMIAGNPESRGK